MKLSQAARIAKQYLAISQNPLFVGPPGIGKTYMLKQIALETNRKLVFMHPSISDPTDFKGMPCVTNVNGESKAHFLPFGEMEYICTTDERVLVIIDDLIQAPTSVQAALMQVLWERRVNGFKIKDGVVFALATNRAQDKAGGSALIEPIKGRVIPLPIEFDSEDWTEWAIDYGISNETIGFNRFRKEFLSEWKPAPKEIVATCTPRTVEIFDNLYRTGNIADNDLFETVKSTVGEAYAAEFSEYLKVFRDLPTAEEIYMNPDKALLPKSGNIGAYYAIATMLGRQITESNVEASIAYMERCKKEEMLIMMLKDGVRVNRACANTKAYTKAVNKYQSLLV